MESSSRVFEKKISVIIPAHNEEHYIGNALTALAQQTFPRQDFEIIVVDNASTDRTSEVAKAGGADTILLESRKGTNQARQTGLENSVGEIVAFLDADCIPEQWWLERLHKKLNKNKNHCAAVAGSYMFSWQEGETFFICQLLYQWIVLPAVSSVVGHIFKRGGVLYGGNFATFREHFEKVEGIDTSFAFFGDDASIAKRLGQIAPVEFDPSLYVASSARRFNRDGVWKTNWEYTKNYFKVMFQPYDHPRKKSSTS